jgi:hypothetical protein
VREDRAVESAAHIETTAAGLPEQISDRAIESAEEDRFGHADFVARLVGVVEATGTPANVALFGRWGSGKTGIANRLRQELSGRDDLHFAYFDAFKFARLSLLRRFLLELARQLGGVQLVAEYRRHLYVRREEVELNRLPADVVKKLRRWVRQGLIGLAVFLFLFVLAMIFVFHPGGRSEALHLLASLVTVFVPSALIVGGATLAAKYLTATTTSEAPSSEEQFEELFGELLRKFEIGAEPGSKKLVVFVDELDRCSASDVAETLEGLKTFLDEPGCVFIVAADQKVLEQALSERVRQSTPVDLTNPYYSAGSAYLDKIFQYQITLPPLPPGRLTRFALELLDGVGGAWAAVPSKEDVVSVLLPVGVQSPRRVKVLLNAFAQAWALVLARSAEGRLSGAVRERTEEVAKLIALQIEFPLFAADLPVHRNLVVMVLAYADARGRQDDEAMERVIEGLPGHVAGLVRGYGSGTLPTDETLPGKAVEELRRRQGSALLDYLRQTSLVLGPRSDLILLESLHRASGLEDGLAAELEDRALRGMPERVAELVGSLEDAGERERAILRIGELVRESQGIDADNSIRALLAAFPALGASEGRVARDLMSAVTRYDERRRLDAEELPGALELAIAGGGNRLRRSILARPEALSEPLRGTALGRAAVLIATEADRLGELLAEEIGEDPARAAQRLLDLDEVGRTRLTAASVPGLREELERLTEELGREELPETEGVDLHEEQRALVDGVAAVAGLLAEGDDQADAEAILVPALQADPVEGTRALEVTLEALGSPLGEVLGAALVEWLGGRPTATFLALAEKIDPTPLEGSAATTLGAILARLWREASGAEGDESGEAMRALSELHRGGAGIAEEPLLDEIRASVRAESLDEALLLARRADLRRLDSLADLGLIGRADACELALGSARTMLASMPPPGLEEQLAAACEAAVSQGAVDADEEERSATIEALEASPWAAAHPPVVENLTLVLAAAKRLRVSGEDPPYAAERIAELSREHRGSFEAGLAAWLAHFRPAPADAAKALSPVLGGRLGERLGTALTNYRRRLDRAGRLALLRPSIEVGGRRHLSKAMLRGLGIEEADPEAVAAMIVEAYDKATNNAERERVVGIWEAMAPVDSAARRELIRGVFLRLLGENHGAYDIARRHLALCADPPHGTKGELVEALGKAAPDKQRGKKMEARMKQVGLPPRRRGLFG